VPHLFIDKKQCTDCTEKSACEKLPVHPLVSIPPTCEIYRTFRDAGAIVITHVENYNLHLYNSEKVINGGRLEEYKSCWQSVKDAYGKATR